MAKSATFFTLFFAFALLLAAFETPMVQGKWCDVPSKTWSGHCGSSVRCDKQCRELEGFEQGACYTRVPHAKCYCRRRC